MKSFNTVAILSLLLTPAAGYLQAHPQAAPPIPRNSDRLSLLLARQETCPDTQVCGEICCRPPNVCNAGAFNWCQSPGEDTAETCDAGLAVCPGGGGCCRIGYICDTPNRMCLPPTGTNISKPPSSTTSTTEDEEETETKRETTSSQRSIATSSISSSATITPAQASSTSRTQNPVNSASSATPPSSTSGSEKLAAHLLGILAWSSCALLFIFP